MMVGKKKSLSLHVLAGKSRVGEEDHSRSSTLELSNIHTAFYIVRSARCGIWTYFIRIK